MTTQIKDRPGDDLLSEKGFGGFPSIAIMDAEGEIVKRDVAPSIAAMKSAVEVVQAHRDVKAKLAAGEKGLEAKLLVAELRLGKVDADAAKKKLTQLRVTGDDKALVEQLIFDKEMAEWLAEARSSRTDPKGFFAKVYGAYKAGRRPSDDEEPHNTFWHFLLNAAEQAGDPEAFELAAEKAVERTRKALMDRLEAVKRKRKAKTKKQG